MTPVIAALRSPLRLLVLGAVLLWVVTPVLVGALLTLGVHASNAGSRGVGTWMVLVLGGLAALVVLLLGFGALLTGVVLWWRARQNGVFDESLAGSLVETRDDSASD